MQENTLKFSPDKPKMASKKTVEFKEQNDERSPLKPSQMMNEMSKTDQRSTADYVVEDHIGVICQMYGSVWPQVLPYCIFNISIAFMVKYFKISPYFNVDLSFPDKGHSFMNLMIAFLVITRCSYTYVWYMKARDRVSQMMKASRELIQHTVSFTRYDKNLSAVQWRVEVARRAIVLLRTTISVLEYDNKKQHIWKISELTDREKMAILHSVGGDIERAPFIILLFLRTAIASHVKHLQTPLDVNEELALMDFTAKFFSAYHEAITNVNTTFPFPIAQMARTLLFMWIFTLPFALENSLTQYFPLMFMVFFLTYGFLGVEFLNIDLIDPFGDKPNDFDCLGLAQVVFDDIYITIRDLDGSDVADSLKFTVEKPKRMSKVLKNKIFSPDDSSEEDLNDDLKFSFKAKRHRFASHDDPRGIIMQSFHPESQSSIDIFETDETIKIDFDQGKIISKERSWTHDYKSREQLM